MCAFQAPIHLLLTLHYSPEHFKCLTLLSAQHSTAQHGTLLELGHYWALAVLDVPWSRRSVSRISITTLLRVLFRSFQHRVCSLMRPFAGLAVDIVCARKRVWAAQTAP